MGYAKLPTSGAVLIVDDAPENLVAMRAALSDMADEVVTAASGRDALRRLVGRDFAVVLLDVSMPDLDGFETARIIRSHSRYRGLPIIFLTAYDRDESEVLRAYRLGAVDFLFKPIQPPVLRAKVSVFVELARRTAEVTAQAERLRELERREHEQELDDQRRQLETAAMEKQMDEGRRTAERLAEIDRRKDEFLAMLGHELRTPLAALVTGLELTRNGEIDGSHREHTEQIIDRQLKHLVRLVDDLVDVTRIRSGRIELKRRLSSVASLTELAAELAGPVLDERRHQLVISLPDEPIAVEVDPVRIVQAISNLVYNAARYTPSGGRIVVDAQRRGPSVTISVEDNGIGISSEALDSVFEMYVQLAPGRGGLGLGLALTKHLVDLHGGTIEAHSEGVGQGARFEISLPVAEPPPSWSADVGDPPALGHTGGAAACEVVRIVIIEDDDDLRETLHALLKSWGHTVTSAASGENGLQLLDVVHPEVVLVDIGLPDMNGCDVPARASALHGSRPRFVALTGFTQNDDRLRIMASGFDSYLPKPPDVDALRRLLTTKEPPDANTKDHSD